MKDRKPPLVEMIAFAWVQVPCTRTHPAGLSIPTVCLFGEVLDDGNCRRVTSRGEEACECLGVAVCYPLGSACVDA